MRGQDIYLCLSTLLRSRSLAADPYQQKRDRELLLPMLESAAEWRINPKSGSGWPLTLSSTRESKIRADFLEEMNVTHSTNCASRWSVPTVITALTLGLGSLLMGPALAGDSTESEALVITTYRSPTCGCCHGWVEHMEAAGFEVNDVVTDDMAAVKQEHGIPEEMLSCHTSVVGDYVIEGHVPVDAVQRLLEEQPDVAGLALPGMPIGSPGMEFGDRVQPYTVLTFDEQGNPAAFQDYP